MKGQRKHWGNRIAFCLFILIFVSSCHSEKRQKGYFLVSYYYTDDGVYNIELYEMNNYSIKESIQKNLSISNKIRCFVVSCPEYDHNYKYVQQLRKIRKVNKFKDMLCKIDFEIVDTNTLSYHFSRSDSVEFDSVTIECDYYFLDMIDGKEKVVFHHFEPIDSVVLK